MSLSENEELSPVESLAQEMETVKNAVLSSLLEGATEVPKDVLILTKNGKTFLINPSNVVDETCGINLNTVKDFCRDKGYAFLNEKEGVETSTKTSRSNPAKPVSQRQQKRKRNEQSIRERNCRKNSMVTFEIGGNRVDITHFFKDVLKVDVCPNVKSDAAKLCRYLLCGIESAFSNDALGISEQISKPCEKSGVNKLKKINVEWVKEIKAKLNTYDKEAVQSMYTNAREYHMRVKESRAKRLKQA
mgnify:CR=1 FL=1|tara:strand:+ start:206 stop:943 length:738 start_codon:yes stop_codon:yes gene_type:complete